MREPIKELLLSVIESWKQFLDYRNSTLPFLLLNEYVYKCPKPDELIKLLIGTTVNRIYYICKTAHGLEACKQFVGCPWSGREGKKQPDGSFCCFSREILLWSFGYKGRSHIKSDQT